MLRAVPVLLGIFQIRRIAALQKIYKRISTPLFTVLTIRVIVILSIEQEQSVDTDKQDHL